MDKNVKNKPAGSVPNGAKGGVNEAKNPKTVTPSSNKDAKAGVKKEINKPAQPANPNQPKRPTNTNEINKAKKPQQPTKPTQPTQSTQPAIDTNNIEKSLEEIKKKTLSVYEQYAKTLKKFEDASVKLIHKENDVLKTTVANSVKLLSQLKIKNLSNIKDNIQEIKLDNKEELLEIKKPSKGRFKGFIFGLIFALAVAAGIFVYGAIEAGLNIEDVNTFLNRENLDKIVLGYMKMLEEMFGIKGGILEGYSLIGIISALVGFVVYKTITITQAVKNRIYINKLHKDSTEYEKKLKRKISVLEQAIEHINKIILVMEKYDVILKEQNAKINRILFIEKPENIDNLHRSSKVEVEKTLLILDEFVKLMNTPVTKNDNINEESIKNLKSANSVINEVIKNLYQ